MDSFKIVFIWTIFTAWTPIVSLGYLVELNLDEIDDFVKTLDTRVIYFETKEAQKNHPLFAEEYSLSASSLDSYGVQLGKVNCSIHKHKNCYEPSDPRLFVFRNEKLLKSLPLEKVNNEHSIVANILHRFVLKDELVAVQSEDHFKEILSSSRGKENLILMNIKGIGMKDYRNFLEVAFAFGDSFKFCLSTKLSADMFGAESKLKAFLCKEKDCEVRHYHDELRVISLATFIQSLTLPLAVILDEDERTPYTKDVISIPINKVYLFVKGMEDVEGYRQQLEDVAKRVKAAVGFVVVEIEKHGVFSKRVGLAEDSSFPALAFFPGHKSEEKDMEYVDVFTSSDRSLENEDLVDFVYELITHPAEVYGKAADTRPLTVNLPVDYLTLVNDLETDYLLIAFCKPSVGECADFSYDYQRLSRTFDRHYKRKSMPKRKIKVSIIYSNEDMDPQFGIEAYPTVRLHKQGKPVTEYISVPPLFIYAKMLDFVKKEIGEPDVLPLPASGLDYIELEHFHVDKPKEENTGDSGEETVDSESSDNPPEETEDDEVAAAGYEIYYTGAVDDSHIPKLNDTSFNITVHMFDISVVLFFLPWDARSQAFSPSYAAAAKTLAVPDGSKEKIGVFQVNCFDWEDVCSKENIKSYPTIRLYRKKQSSKDYQGSLDESSLVATVKLLQAPAPIKLTSDGEAVGFQDGKYPMTSILHTAVSVLGLFSVENSEYVTSFHSAARKMEGKFLFGYATGKVALDAASRLGVQAPSIVLMKRNDPLQNKAVFRGDYSEQAIVYFVKYSSLPVYGELTPLNFPTYFSKEQPFLIAFIHKSDDKINSLMSDVVKSNELVGVNFCWVDISVKVNRDILEAYTMGRQDKRDLNSAIVLVHHQKGTTYTYDGKLQNEDLVSWSKRCLSGAEDFSGKLKTNDWKPRLEGYDFLKMIQEEAESGQGNGDPWETSGSNENEADGDGDGDEISRDDDTSTVPENPDHSAKFHAAFHAKKQLRLDQRRRVIQKPVHEPHTEL